MSLKINISICFIAKIGERGSENVDFARRREQFSLLQEKLIESGPLQKNYEYDSATPKARKNFNVFEKNSSENAVLAKI